MIQKVDQLISIGKFRNFTASGDVSFRKLTLIYADNGGGKTTLTSVFRSLTKNDPLLLQKRKSTNSAITQVAHILERNATGDVHHHFNGTNWTVPLEGIEVFDIHFVNENVYSGFEFSDEHKKNLHEFVLDAQGIAIKLQINQNKEQKTASHQTQKQLIFQLIGTVGNGLTEAMISSFLSTSAASAVDIDDKILRAETALTHARSVSVIRTLNPLSPLTRVAHHIDLASLSADFATTISLIQDEALRLMFENHCKELAQNELANPENWLRIGLRYVEKKLSGPHSSDPLLCPFCKQQVAPTSEIIRAYALKFNQLFNELVARLQAHSISTQSFNADSILLALGNLVSQNSERISAWTPFMLPAVAIPSLDLVRLTELLKTSYQALVSALTTKQLNPTDATSVTHVETFSAAVDEANRQIDEYNSLVAQYNAAIANLRTQITTVESAQAHLDQMKRIKLRFDPQVDTLCGQLTSERQTSRALEQAYPALIQQQEAAAATFLSTYKVRVNHYLDAVFRTPFKIADVTHIPPVGRATYSKLGYKLTIDGQDISFDLDSPNGVKECLSEGDRSTLALALFLSKLDIDPSLRDKVVLFDDPLSSFDTNRRVYTVDEIQKVLPRISQSVVLSHNEFFLAELAKGTPAGDKKTLRISEDFTTRAAYIEPLDLDALVENEYFKQIKELEDFRRHPDIAKRDHIIGLLRTILEAHLRFKFYRHFAAIPREQQTLGRLIDALDTQAVILRDNLNRSDIIRRMRTINSVSCRPHHGEPMPDVDALPFNPATISLVQLDGLIVDEFELLDTKL